MALAALLERWSGRLHLALALGAAALVLASPWLRMVTRLPARPGFFNLSHVLLGAALTLLVLAYLAHCSLGGRWRLYFPWLAGQFSALGGDAVGLLRGRLPAAEGGGLFAVIEGLLLLALLFTGLSGLAWLLAQGGERAGDFYEVHVWLARGFVVLMVLHALSVSTHLLELVRD